VTVTAVVTAGTWWCEHLETEHVGKTLSQQLVDPGTTDMVACKACRTGWICLPGPGGRRVAKAVVVQLAAFDLDDDDLGGNG
jgi:hypothetical protein